MRMYPGYDLKKVLKEYARTFFTLLNEGYRLQNADTIRQIKIIEAAFADSNDKESFMQQLKWASMHPDDILGSDGEASSAAEIKKLLG